MSIYQQVYNKINALQDEIVNYAIELLAFPTVSGKEFEAQKYIESVLGKLKFDHINIWEPNIEDLKGHEAFISERKDFTGSPNVVGILKGVGNGKSLMFNSHIDVVPEGEHAQWTYPPFTGTVDNGKIYGRGVSDMKGTKASIFGALRAIQELGIKLNGDIIFESVIEEESGGSGSLACALKGYKADAAIIAEPVGFSLCPAQQGSMWFRVNIQGKSYHGAKRYFGVSAIDKAYLIISSIRELEEYRNQKYTSTLYKDNPIPFTINIGNIYGGVWPSTVPEKVSIEGRMGVAPIESITEARKMFEDWMLQAAGKDPWLKDNKPVVEWFGAFWGAAQIDIYHPIVQVTQEAYIDVLGKKPIIEGTPFGTDARALTVYSSTPTLVFGPGLSAHCPDEFLEVESLINYSKVIAKVILDWCGYEQNV